MSKVTKKSTEEKSVTTDRKILDWVAFNLNVFLKGIIDTFSLHKTLPILVNDRPSAWLTAQILATNAVLLLGSIYFFERGVSPLLGYMKNNLGPESEIGYADKVVYVLYQALWLLPICGLCYGCSMVWYQDLADSTYRYLKGMPKATALTKSVGHALYGTLVWLSAFIQVKLLAAVLPMLFSYMSDAVEVFFLGWTTSAANGTASSPFLTSVAMGIKHSLHMWIRTASIGSRYTGLALLCLMYGWYGFDPKWIASGLDPDERFGILEKHWAYFIGFGFPYVLLMENTSFFVGYGVFLAMFPFCIMLGSVCDYTAPYAEFSRSAAGAGGKGNKKKAVGTSTGATSATTTAGAGDIAGPLPMLKTARAWTLLVIKYIDRSAYQKKQKQKPLGGAEAVSKAKKTS